VFAGAKWEAALALSNWLIKSNRVQSPDVTQISPKGSLEKRNFNYFASPCSKKKDRKKFGRISIKEVE
jgi:hypothetical protein